MSTADEYLLAALRELPTKPSDGAPAAKKKGYSEKMSAAAANALAQALRDRGLVGTKPSPPGESSLSGAERRMAGGIGAKKVDVTWATDEAGLLLAISIKTINFRDSRTDNYQKNLTNRRGDMLFEAVTLHRRFPYAVLGGFFFFDAGAAEDSTESRQSTLTNAHERFRIFTGRVDPAGRDEQFEAFYFVTIDANPFQPKYSLAEAGHEAEMVTLDETLDMLLARVAERNSDFYRFSSGRLVPVR